MGISPLLLHHRLRAVKLFMVSSTLWQTICRLYSADWIWFRRRKDWNTVKQMVTVMTARASMAAAV